MRCHYTPDFSCQGLLFDQIQRSQGESLDQPGGQFESLDPPGARAREERPTKNSSFLNRVGLPFLFSFPPHPAHQHLQTMQHTAIP